MQGESLAHSSLVVGAGSVLAQTPSEISRATESIHQESVINASRNGVYDAPADPRQFNGVVKIAAGGNPAISLETEPTILRSNVRTAFSLFGGISIIQAFQKETQKRWPPDGRHMIGNHWRNGAANG